MNIMHWSIASLTPKPSRIVGIVRGKYVDFINACVGGYWEIAKNLQLHTSILGVGSKLSMIDDAKPS